MTQKKGEEYMKGIKILWLDEEARIASFHEVRGYVPYPLLDKASFLRFIESLTEKGYCFQ